MVFRTVDDISHLDGGTMRNQPTQSNQPTHTDNQQLARRTGLAYLGIIATGIFAEFAVRGSLIAEDDPITTADNIAGSPGLFGVGIGADVVMIALDVVVAFGLFGLLRHVDRRLARTATALRLVQGAVLAVNLVNLAQALGFARDAADVDGTVLAGPAQDVLDAVERHALGYDAGLIAFGLSCLVLARILATSRLVSRPLAIGMYATGVVYLVGSFAALAAPSLSTVIDPFYAIPLVVELAFAIRLVTRGLQADTTESPQPVPVAV
ncbi:MAG: DUF4386 domain-containing protein [Acidimicrobiales bacterium]|nr:DUF4386 domain-containing protein [Acidimicrobiales bacterium]